MHYWISRVDKRMRVITDHAHVITAHAQFAQFAIMYDRFRNLKSGKF